ncbi:MAG: cyclase family protein [Bacteroidales bacterium]|nr:cyclase family protein [Bacteroidales bacterium]
MKIIDLTQTISSEMPVYPGTGQPTILQATSVEWEGFAEKLITFYSHTGTHIDAPCHILAGKKSLDKFGADKFVGEAMVIDVSVCPGGIIDETFVSRYEEEMTQVDFLLFYSGWDSKWGSEDYYRDFPVLTHEAAIWLTQRNLKGVGYDSISADPVSAQDLVNHKLLLGSDMIIIENLCNLDKLMGKNFTLVCLPLKIKDSDGSPARAVAMVKKHEN